MNATQALAQARKRWGKTAAVRDEGPSKASSPELRAAASEKLQALRAELPEPKARTKEQKQELSRASWGSMHYRYTVGEVWSIGGFGMFSVNGQGDTWAEAFAQADKRDERIGVKPKSKVA